MQLVKKETHRLLAIVREVFATLLPFLFAFHKYSGNMLKFTIRMRLTVQFIVSYFAVKDN